MKIGMKKKVFSWVILHFYLVSWLVLSSFFFLFLLFFITIVTFKYCCINPNLKQPESFRYY